MQISPQISFRFSVILGFALLVLIGVALAVLGLQRVADSRQQVEQVVHHHVAKADLVHRMKAALRERKILLQQLVLATEPVRQKEILQQLDQQVEAYLAAHNTLEAMSASADEQALYRQLRVLMVQVEPTVKEALELAGKGNVAQVQKLVETDIEQSQRRMVAGLDQLLAVQKRESDVAVSDARKSFEFTRLHMLILASIAIAIALMVVPVVIRKARSQADSLQQQALYDPLTRLPSRQLLNDRLQQAVISARHARQAFGLFLLDIDRFRDIHRRFGRDTGDRLLQYLAACIQANLDEPDTLARLEGGGFAVLTMSVQETDAAIALVKKIRQSIRQPLDIQGNPLTLTASVGMVMFPHHGDSAGELLRAAEAALAVARNTRRGYRLFSNDMSQGDEDRLALGYELRAAVANDELTLHYQPKIDYGTDRVSGLEVLVRWEHPANGLLLPEDFLPLAEQLGLTKAINDWVLDTAMQQYRDWHQEGMRLPLSVKVTQASLQDPAFPDQMSRRLQKYGVPAAMFELEIKESGALAEPNTAKTNLRRLSAMGFPIAIADFGGGHAALSYLTEFNVAHIKLDPALVKDMAVNRGGSMVVQTTVRLGHTLGLKVVAKGVESQDSWKTLQGFGCDAAQGYFVSRPMPALELQDWLSTSPWNGTAARA